MLGLASMMGLRVIMRAISHALSDSELKVCWKCYQKMKRREPNFSARIITYHFSEVRGVSKKSGLASEPVTLDPEHLELNGQVLRIPHIICVNLVYSSFFSPKIEGDIDPSVKK